MIADVNVAERSLFAWAKRFGFLGIFNLLARTVLATDQTWEYAVQLSASVQTSPAQITLSWVQDGIATPISYAVYRKGPAETGWGSPTVLPGTTTSFSDAGVSEGGIYEYQVRKTASTYLGFGYIYAGINAPLVEDRGKVLLIVDSTYALDLSSELARLQQDLAGDGWTVIRQDVSRYDSVPSVKAFIQSQYSTDPANVKCVFLFGHVPVPYSGNISPDEHSPDHKGAWPADVYYGDMDGNWTDSSVNNSAAADPRNRNVPGDGKFDQSYIPSAVELMVGRVDLANMPGRRSWDGSPSFPNELDLLRQYLNKDHNFRNGLTGQPRRGLISDSFGDFGGYAFSASGWRNFAPFFGPGNIDFLPNQGTWLPTLSGNGYLWAYGCGPGQYTSITGLGQTSPYYQATTTDLVGTDIEAVFTMLFGSYLGDWDSEDNFQRAVLATPTHGLTCCWSGSPHWFCHHMVLGETIGYSTRLTQNNGPGGLYQTQTNTYAGQVHIALMGDPTLRMHPVAPASALAGMADSTGIHLSWAASTDSVLGYHVYRGDSPGGPFKRMTSIFSTSNSYTDPTAFSNTYTYMVRAIKLEATSSGTYFNPSQGAFIAVTGAPPGKPLSMHVDSIGFTPEGVTLNWTATPGKIYRVAFTESITNSTWTDFNPDITADASTVSWTDVGARTIAQRFYHVLELP